MKKYDKGALMEISQVFAMLSHVEYHSHIATNIALASGRGRLKC